MKTNDLINDVIMLIPLQMIWKPKEDITAYELALCLQYLNRNVMPYELNLKDKHLRHFEIIDHNEKK